MQLIKKGDLILMSMVDKQNIFTGMVAKLIIFAQAKGYQLTFGEAFRTEGKAKSEMQQMDLVSQIACTFFA